MKALIFGLALIAVLLTACAAPQPTTKDIGTGNTVQTVNPTSESGIPYVGGDGLPQDERLYIIKGKVVADVSSLTRQTAPAYGSTSGYNGYISGYYVGPSVNGKSFTRILVKSIDPSNTDWVAAGQIVIIKGTDTKMTALLPGDVVNFLCRRQAEAIAAIHPNEWYNAKTNTTWELDYCRMDSPVITVETPTP